MRKENEFQKNSALRKQGKQNELLDDVCEDECKIHEENEKMKCVKRISEEKAEPRSVMGNRNEENNRIMKELKRI